MTFAFYFAAVGFLAFLPNTYASVDFCGGTHCNPDYGQEAYCCNYNSETCCYTTNVATLWWFWVVLIFVILFFSVCCTTLCCRHRRRSRTGYVVVRGETYAPTTTVIQTHSHAAQVVRAPQPYSGGYPQPYNGQGYPVHEGYQATAPTADCGYSDPKYQQQPPKYEQQPPNYQQPPPKYE